VQVHRLRQGLRFGSLQGFDQLQKRRLLVRLMFTKSRPREEPAFFVGLWLDGAAVEDLVDSALAVVDLLRSPDTRSGAPRKAATPEGEQVVNRVPVMWTTWCSTLFPGSCARRADNSSHR
jgi:hypothetical protein